MEEEADEVIYWLDLIGECGLANKQDLIPLAQEAEELLRMTVASIRTARNGARKG